MNKYAWAGAGLILAALVIGAVGGVMGGPWFMPAVGLDIVLGVAGGLLLLINIRLRDRDDHRG